MSQFDFATIDPNAKSGTQLAVDLNNWRDALHSGHRGADRPAYAQAGMLWVREASAEQWDLMFYDGDTDFVLRSVNPTTNQLIGIPQERVSGLPDAVVAIGTAQAAADAAQAAADAAYRKANILGTVSQSGGVPTGAIIERGSNANGEYTRWADGTQICTADVPTSNSADTIWTFPAGFAPGTTPRVTGNSSDSSSTTSLALKTHTTTDTSTRLMLITGANARSSGAVSVAAHGRWY